MGKSQGRWVSNSVCILKYPDILCKRQSKSTDWHKENGLACSACTSDQSRECNYHILEESKLSERCKNQNKQNLQKTWVPPRRWQSTVRVLDNHTHPRFFQGIQKISILTETTWQANLQRLHTLGCWIIPWAIVRDASLWNYSFGWPKKTQ